MTPLRPLCFRGVVPYRIETGRLDRAERVAGGGLRVPATVGRAGVLEYRREDGSTWREYRPAEELAAAASLASVRGAPVTDLHPPRPVDPSTYRHVARGHAGDDPRVDGDHLAVSLYVQDGDLMRAIETGERREVSAGYEVDLEHAPGVAPDGTPYDAIQRRVRYNHIALGPSGWGRAGPSVALRLDARLEAIDDDRRPADAGQQEVRGMRIAIRVDGIDYSVEVDETAAKALPAGLAKERAEADAARKALAEATSRADAAEKARDEARGRADGLEASAKAAADPQAISALVRARVELERKAAALKPAIRCDGLTDRAIMLEAIGLKDEQRHGAEYVAGRFDAMVEAAGRSDASLRETRIVAEHADGGGDLDELERAQLRMIERNRNAWKEGA